MYFKCHNPYHQYSILYNHLLIESLIIDQDWGHIDQYHCIVVYIYLYIMSNQLIMTDHD